MAGPLSGAVKGWLFRESEVGALHSPVTPACSHPSLDRYLVVPSPDHPQESETSSGSPTDVFLASSLSYYTGSIFTTNESLPDPENYWNWRVLWRPGPSKTGQLKQLQQQPKHCKGNKGYSGGCGGFKGQGRGGRGGQGGYCRTAPTVVYIIIIIECTPFNFYLSIDLFILIFLLKVKKEKKKTLTIFVAI